MFLTLIQATGWTKAFQADPSVATHSPDVGTLIADIEAGRLADAQYSTRWAGDSASGTLRDHWRSLIAEQQKNGESLESKRDRFLFLDFYFRHCDLPELDSEFKPKMFADLMKLAKELQIAPDALPAVPETFELLDKCSGQRRAKATTAEINQLGQEVIKAVSERPDDGAAWAALKNVVKDLRMRGFEGKRGRNQNSFDYKALIASATTPYSKAKLLSVVKDFDLPDDLRKTVIASGLPYLSCDEERASYRSNEFLLIDDPNRRIALANEIFDAYPRTDTAKWVCGSKIAAFASSQGAEQALKVLEVDRIKLSLSADEVRNIQLDIAKSVAPDVAKELLIDLSNQWAGTAQQALAIERLFVFAWQQKSTKDSIKEAERWAEKRLALLAPNERLAGNNFAPQLGQFYMAQKRWENARIVWSLWVPNGNGCGCWEVEPDEFQKLQIQLCLLHQNKHREAVESMLATMDGRVVPVLLFYTYDRAGQIEDIKQIIARHRSDPNSKPQDWRASQLFDAEHSPAELSPLHLSPKENWQVPQLMRLRELALRKDAETLCKFLISFQPSSPFVKSHPIPDSDPPLESSLWVEACRLLAEMGDESVPAIEKACLDKNSNKSKAWLVRSLLANRSQKAQDFLLKIMNQPNLKLTGKDDAAIYKALALGVRAAESRRGGKGSGAKNPSAKFAPYGVIFTTDEQPVPLTFTWPSAPMGSLPSVNDLFP